VYLLNTVVQLVVGYTPECPLVILLARKLLFEYQRSRDTVSLLPFWVLGDCTIVVVCDTLFRAYQAELVTRRRHLQVMAIRL
jgi:hypothetical protein